MNIRAPRSKLKALGSAAKVQAKAHPHAMGHTIHWEEKAQDQMLAAVEQEAVALQFHEQERSPCIKCESYNFILDIGKHAAA